jgi:hypothetical protein
MKKSLHEPTFRKNIDPEDGGEHVAYHTKTKRHVAEDGNMHNYSCENLKSCTELLQCASVKVQSKAVLVDVSQTTLRLSTLRAGRASFPRNIAGTHFADWGCRVVSAAAPHGCILHFLERGRYLFFQLYSRG